MQRRRNLPGEVLSHALEVFSLKSTRNKALKKLKHPPVKLSKPKGQRQQRYNFNIQTHLVLTKKSIWFCLFLVEVGRGKAETK